MMMIVPMIVGMGMIVGVRICMSIVVMVVPSEQVKMIGLTGKSSQ
jgi:hypothetical protein